jgi:hypothetical protein
MIIQETHGRLKVEVRLQSEDRSTERTLPIEGLGVALLLLRSEECYSKERLER